jgi:hypothetical protein
MASFCGILNVSGITSSVHLMSTNGVRDYKDPIAKTHVTRQPARLYDADELTPGTTFHYDHLTE